MSNLVSILTNFVIGSTIIFLTITLRTDFTLGAAVDRMRFNIIIRTDLGMSSGKSATQAVHVAISCYKKALQRNPKEIKIWEYDGQPKIVLKPNQAGDGVLYSLVKTAERYKLVTCIINDTKQTGMKQGQVTAIGIGPGKVGKIHQITGHLKLL